MLVIISDLHLTDGSSGTTIGLRAFEIFKERISEMAYKASWRLDEKGNRFYQPVEAVDIILLGDILDVIRSEKWIHSAVRPWTDPQSPEFAAMVAQINEDILTHNREAFKLLRDLSRSRKGKSTKGMMTLPLSTEKKLPMMGFQVEGGNVPRSSVKVRIHYMVGNHDWFYHLQGEAFDDIRKKVVDALGLANDPCKPFPHTLEEYPELAEICARHGVYVRHGDIFDSINYDAQKGRDASTLGDAIVVELLNRFPAEIKKRLSGQLSPACLQGLLEIDNVRPLMFIPIWINGLLERTCPEPTLKQQVKEIWNELAGDFMKLDFIRRQDTIMPFETVDLLEMGLFISQKTSFRTISNIMGKIAGLKRSAGETYYPEALKEPAFQERTADFIVYGHTHHQEVVPLDATEDAEQLYFNSGTWRQVFELTRANRKAQMFLGFQVMTYIGFFKNGERSGRKFEIWNGSLGDK
ncbi:MAG: hypothetical protein R3D00_19920 [Bacteroidia bacterium]